MSDINNKAWRSWFCVLNNPDNIWEGTPKDIAEVALSSWIDNKSTRSGAVAYCISAEGLHHLHMVLEDSNKARFSALKKAFPTAHLEPTFGSKDQAEAYINKTGEYEEKGEQVLYVAKIGEITSNQGKRKDLEVIELLINNGYTPRQILDMQFSFRRYDKMIKDAYFDKRFKETDVLRDVKVVWHLGDSGSGKSYTYKKLCDAYGDDEIYFVGDYDVGYLDRYNGERVLFLDEFRGQIRYGTLLSMLGGYRTPIHARYSDIYALWTEVHITSVLPPEVIYRKMVSENRDLDTLKQLYRRIDTVVLHWKYPDDTFSEMSVPMSSYKGYDHLRSKAGVDFSPVKQQELPF